MNSKTTNGFALITGAASGIGKNATLSIAESGAAGILFADINEKGAEESAIESKKYASNPAYRAIFTRVDITENSVQATAIQEFGRIDYNVNSAGIGTTAVTGMADLPLSEFDNVLNVNMKGTVLCNRAVLKAMLTQEPREFQGRYAARSLGRGCIVNLGSAYSYAPTPGKTSYTTAKHAVIGITKTAAVDYSKQGIRVNAVCPIWVERAMTEREAQVNPHLDQIVQAVVPLKRMAQADEVADAIQFLCSPAASLITGADLIIDAGTGLTVRLI